ncbi:MAG: phosphatidate cytidylyltransferase [Treponema sp.]|nr:phosphatidate cytidylyltransferase [Treponema sp.]
MKKIISRLLVFFIGLPVIFAMVFVLPQYYHLVFNLLAVALSALGAMEFSVLLAQKKILISKTGAAILGALPPSVMILILNLNLSDMPFFAVIAVVVSWLLASGIFARGDMLDNFLNRFAAGFAVLLYPGMSMALVVRMSRWEKNASIIIFIFLGLVFFTDGLAWVTGMLFGKGNQGIIPVSPHKSVAGFIGGAIASVAIGAGAALLYPEVFVPRFHSIMGMPSVAGSLLGLLTGIAAVIGDLGESAIKRSSGLKDSGHIIPGRGGVLDSIDSLVPSAPVYYLIFSLLFIQP